MANKHILLTIDVEDWFQVENFKPYIPFSSWPERELRVEQNTHRLLDLFDSVESAGKPGSLEGGKVGTNVGIEDQNKELNEPNQLNNFSESVYKSHAAAPASNKQHTTHHKHTKKVHCTFFVLGWLADRLPSSFAKSNPADMRLHPMATTINCRISCLPQILRQI